MLSDPAEDLSPLVDKLASRDYVASRVGSDLLIPLLGYIDDPSELIIKDACVLKATHGSGMVRVISDPSNVDSVQLKAELRLWLNTDYSVRFRERPYKYVKPRIIVEKYMGDEGTSLTDYKFYVFRGKVRLLQIIQNRETALTMLHVARDGRIMRATKRHPLPRLTPEAPRTLARMVEISEALAGDLDFARVDMYEVAGRPYFGEITLYPGAGLTPFHPWAFEEELGAVWRERRDVDERWLSASRLGDGSILDLDIAPKVKRHLGA